ncbi:MAG: DUF4038 domain-containing protein [Chloroflexota bacterium]
MSPRLRAGGIYEWELSPPADQSLTVASAVQLQGPSGQSMRLTGFADGEVARVRLGPVLPGIWRWHTAADEHGAIEVEADAAAGWIPPLRFAANRRHLVHPDGKPFLWLADTAWSIVFKGSSDEWGTYLDRRAKQGYSVLQVTLLPWRWDWTDAERNRPFHNGDPTRPNTAYFRRYEQFLEMAAERGLVVCLMLIWGGPRPLLPAIHFSQAQAVEFARYAVSRFAAFPCVWSVSGDAEYITELAKWNAVGAVVEETDPYGRPTTNHLPPQMNWVGLHADAAWHDFHMIQTGHRESSVSDIADLPAAYFKRTPTKGFVNGEPWYEAHPSRDTAEYGPTFTAYDARYAFWVSILSGAGMGHTYGSQGIWNWKHTGDSEEEVAGPQIGPAWTAALEHAGAAHCGLGANLLRSLPWWQLSPAPERVHLQPRPADPVRRPVCAIAEDATWLVYAPAADGRLTLKGIPPLDWQAEWFDPRTGDRHHIGTVAPGTNHCWQAPPSPTPEDWLLVVTRASERRNCVLTPSASSWTTSVSA